jgi:molecular chaperone DnaJ
MASSDHDEFERVLGVSWSADASSVKKAYRERAMQWHPDRNADDPAMRARFETLNRLYAAWSSEHGGAPNAGAAPGGVPFDAVGLEELLRDFFGTMPKASAPRRGADRSQPLVISRGDALVGCGRDVSIARRALCTGCKGTGAAEGTGIRACSDCDGKGMRAVQTGMFAVSTACPACRGRGRVPERACTACNDGLVERSERVSVRVPAGVQSGYRLRLRGKGDDAFGGEAGDLYLAIEVPSSGEVVQRESDAVVEMVLPVRNVFFGGHVEVSMHDGRANVSVPLGVRDGAIQRVAGRGFARARAAGEHGGGDPYRGDDARGDAIVVFRVSPDLARLRIQAVLAVVMAAVATVLVAILR